MLIAGFIAGSINRIVAAALLFGALLLLYGCSTNPLLDNRVYCSMDRQHMVAVTQRLGVSVGLAIDPADAAIACADKRK